VGSTSGCERRQTCIEASTCTVQPSPVLKGMGPGKKESGRLLVRTSCRIVTPIGLLGRGQTLDRCAVTTGNTLAFRHALTHANPYITAQLGCVWFSVGQECEGWCVVLTCVHCQSQNHHPPSFDTTRSTWGSPHACRNDASPHSLLPPSATSAPPSESSADAMLTSDSFQMGLWSTCAARELAR